jgi:uncharacterized protein YeaO (DUF488 family)
MQGETMAIHVKRAYDKPARNDGFRVLVDRVWPRGVTKEALKVDTWLRNVAPSTRLRKWFGHDPKKWDEFRRRYFKELDADPEDIRLLREKRRGGELTLVFGAKEERFNNAEAIKEYLERH